MSSRCRDVALRIAIAAWAVATAGIAVADDATRTLRVCAHPDNLPFSAQDEMGFDNRIAKVLADELHANLEYTWLQPQHGLVRKTLGAGLCDVLMGLPKGYEGALTTVPYYRSRYVFMYRRDAHRFASFDDPALRVARVGVQVVGDDMAATPPGHALVASGARHVVGFPVYGDAPAVSRMATAIAHGDLDAGLAWGPAAGYFAARQDRALDLSPANAPAELQFLPFEVSIAAAVRRERADLKHELDAAIGRRRDDIDRILADYHVPVVPPELNTAARP